MSRHIEWSNAETVEVMWADSGVTLGADTVSEGKRAVVLFDYDFLFVVEGEPMELYHLARRMLDAALGANLSRPSDELTADQW